MRSPLMFRIFIGAILVILGLNLQQTAFARKFLFDATKAEMASNADWVIDADTQTGGQSNPQRIPTPAQSGITASTPETYWSGAISSWGVELVKRGHIIETLPISGAITYGSRSNVQDLSNYDVFVVVEPNSSFSTTEKSAIINFVAAGGSLFMVADHNGSDRNNDGIDSPHAWNDLMSTNSVQANPFGMLFNLNSYSYDSYVMDTAVSDSIIRGAAGTVTQFNFDAGTTLTISTTNNPTVRGAVWYSSRDNWNVMVAYAQYGRGKVVGIGDSSPCDDGTGDTGDQLYYGWTDASGNHGKLFTNASLWLAATNFTGIDETVEPMVTTFSLAQNYPNPFNNATEIPFSLRKPGLIKLSIFDANGRLVRVLSENNYSAGEHSIRFQGNDLASGTYYYQLKGDGLTTVKSFQLLK